MRGRSVSGFTLIELLVAISLMGLMAALACVWMYRDARSRGRSLASVLSYFLLTAVFVSVGPLLYIVLKGLRDE